MRFVIEDVFTITGRGLVVTGIVQEAQINTGDIVILSIDGLDYKTIVSGVERFGTKIGQEQLPGEKIGVLLQAGAFTMEQIKQAHVSYLRSPRAGAPRIVDSMTITNSVGPNEPSFTPEFKTRTLFLWNDGRVTWG